MKTSRLAAIAALAACAAPAFAASFTIDFEKNWDYGSEVAGYYGGGIASDGTTGTNLGVDFVGVSGLSNDGQFPNYYDGAPSMLGVAYAFTDALTPSAYMNVAAGVSGALSLSYAGAEDVAGAIKAYSGLNGTGTLLGTIDLAATGSGYDRWNAVTLSFAGTAMSFDLTGSAGRAIAFDNISAVPEPASIALMLAGSAVLVLRAKRRRV